MSTLLAAVLALTAAVALGRLPPPTRPADRATWWRRGLVALLLLLPLLHALMVLAGSRERLRMLRFDYVGKQLSFSADRPITAGGSPAGAAEVEDLYAPGLPPRSLALMPWTADEAGGEAGNGEAAGLGAAARLVLASPGPAVAVDGVLLNSVDLADGDEIVVDRPGAEPVFLVYRGGAVGLDGREVALRGLVGRIFGGNGRVYDLASVGRSLGVDLGGVYSFLRHPGVFGPWQLVIRSDEVSVERGGETVAGFVREHPLPAVAELDLGVVLNDRLRSRRRDRLRIADGNVEVRFDTPRVWTVTVPPEQPEVELALTVPSAFARQEMIELPEPSSRFRGLSAVYGYDRPTDAATLTYFGDRQEVVPGDLYALGLGEDRLLLRLEQSGFPWQLVLDLALFGLFFAVFLGRGLVAHAGLAAVVGPLGVLLGHRLLFSYKVATQPPDFSFEPLQEARLALWLVPAMMLAAWTAAWWLRQPADKVLADKVLADKVLADKVSADKAPASFGDAVSRVAWPLWGLAVAAGGCWAVADAGRRELALVPLLLAAALALGMLLLVRSERARDGLERIQDQGLPASALWLAGLGLVLLVVRWIAAQIGMPETLRLPMVGFRLLWTVVQLPLAAAVVGIAIHALVRERRPRQWLLGLLAAAAFLGFAFLGVGVAVRDTGLFLAHALAPFVALLTLVFVPLGFSERPAWQRLGLCALPALPLLAMLTVNAYPETLIRVVGWGTGAAGAVASAEGESASPVRDSAAQLGANRSQQLFRLYMLASPQRLSESGLIASERVAIHYATLQSYADEGGFRGRGYLASKLPRHLGITYLSDLVPMVFVLPDFGKLGLFALTLLYLALLAAVPLTAPAVGTDSPFGSQGLYVALVALLAVAVPSLYMILANLNLVLFTGKNLSLLSLNSLSDVFQGGALLALAVLGLGLKRGVTA